MTVWKQPQSDVLLSSLLNEEIRVRKQQQSDELVSTLLDEEIKVQMQDALEGLSDRERKVLELRYGLQDGRQHTLQEVGQEFGVSDKRIRQIEAKALRKLRHPIRSRKLRDYVEDKEVEERPQEDFLGIGVFDDRIRLVSLSKDGQYRFADGTEKVHNIFYVVSTEALAMQSSIEELEYLMNANGATEKNFQDFFERNPRFILNDEYGKAHPHIALAREEGPLIPDFLLEPLDQNELCDILDLKLPTAKIFVLKKSRMRYSAAVLEACAQLREYNNYFDEPDNRDRILREYGLLAYKPRMILIIGRKGGIDPISFRKIQSDAPQLLLRTYDDVLARAKSRLQKLK